MGADEGQVLPPEDEESFTVWYLGYGSMCNPVSLRRRELFPAKSLPVTTNGWELEFSWNGMANVVPQPGAVLHGVAHLLTPKMFAALQVVEAVYDVTLVDAQPYGGGPPVSARMFYIPHHTVAASKDHTKHAGEEGHLPSERYIRIITEGLRHFGADPAWIARIAAHPFVPSRPRHTWLRAPPAADAAPRAFTTEELAEHRGRLPAHFAIGSRVLRADLTDGAHPFASILKMLSGQKACFMYIKNLYDPSLPPVETPNDLQDIHREWAEDEAMSRSQKYGFRTEVVGWLDEGGGERTGTSGPVPGTAQARGVEADGPAGGSSGSTVPAVAAAGSPAATANSL